MVMGSPIDFDGSDDPKILHTKRARHMPGSTLVFTLESDSYLSIFRDDHWQQAYFQFAFCKVERDNLHGFDHY